MIDIPAPKPISDLQVLVIDGQTLVHDVIKTALADMNINKVKFAENAYFALRLCESVTFDIIMVAFDVKSDKDGFNLLEEMKFKGYVQETTTVIFLSADTSAELVNCVIELQPSDFWVKPLSAVRLQQRMRHIINVNHKLFKLHYCIDKGEYATGIYYAERQLLDASLEQYHPQIHRLIGDCLMRLREFSDAEAFYRRLSVKYDYAWVKVGLARSLLKQEKTEEALSLCETLMERKDTRFTTYDVLAEYYIEQEDYQKGYEIIQKATALAPRNIERNKKSWNLARLNHDRTGQYIATQNMAKFAKNSIHDTPNLQLNVVRASIDLAATLPEVEANKLLMRAERQLNTLRESTQLSGPLNEQLHVIEARICSARHDKQKAEDIITKNVTIDVTSELEDNLDKVKALHEMGQREMSLKLLGKVKSQVESDSFIGQVVGEYLSQEQEERENIHYSPKELAEMASSHYKHKRYAVSFEMLEQALQLNPDNINFGLSLLKVGAILVEENELTEHQADVIDNSIRWLSEETLSPNQQMKLNEYCSRIDPRSADSA